MALRLRSGASASTKVPWSKSSFMACFPFGPIRPPVARKSLGRETPSALRASAVSNPSGTATPTLRGRRSVKTKRMKREPRPKLPTEIPLDDGAREGTDLWREIGGVRFCHWGRWLLRLALNEPEGLRSIAREFRRRAAAPRSSKDGGRGHARAARGSRGAPHEARTGASHGAR